MLPLDPSIPLTCRVLGALVFAGAALGKLRHATEFTGVVANYRLLPEALATPAAWLVVVLEIAVALSLAAGLWLSAGVTLGCVLLAVFALAMGVNLARGRRQIDCGCFQSALRQHLRPALLVRNALLTGLLLVAVLPAAPGISALQWVDGIAAGLVLFLVYQAGNELLALRDAVDALRKRFA